MTLGAHIRELRRRILAMLVIVAIGAIAGWYLYEPVLALLKQPYCSVTAKRRYSGMSGCDLVYYGVLDGFTTRLGVSLITAS
jgi:sec-independent protein translocase protein TatC